MVSALRIAALLGLLVLPQAQGNDGPWSNRTTTTSQDCQSDDCLIQFAKHTEVTPFCAIYTTAVITQEAAYPKYMSPCLGNSTRISSACSCVVSGPPSMCQPSTITVTFTPPIQTYTTTENLTITILQPTTATTDVYISTTITSHIYSNVTQTEISTTTTTTTTEEETTTTTTLEETTTEIDTATTTSFTTDTETDTATTTTQTTVSTTTTTTATTTSIVTSNITTSFPVTTTMAYFTTLTDTVTGPPLTFTSFITQVSWVTTILTTSFFTTATQTVPILISVTSTDTETATEVDVTISTLPASTITTSILGSLTTITLPASTVATTVPSPTTATAPTQTTTLPGVTLVQTITTTLPGVVTTVTAAGIITTITLPGVTSVITTIITLPGIPTTFPPVTVTVTNGIVTCPGPTPTTTVASALPTDYTWGCPPGSVCHPPKPAGCGVFAEPPTVDYVCQPSQCVVAPPFARVTAGWGGGVDSNDTSFFPPQKDYFNLSPLAFGLSFDIFSEEVEVLEVVGPNGMQTPTTVTTGDWSSQTSITSQPTPDISDSSAKKVKRSISRRSSTVPAACYNECNNCYIEAQQEGKTPALCSKSPPSAFMQDLTACQECVAAHGDTTQQSLKTYVDPEFAQYLDYCQGQAAQSAGAPSSTTVQSEVSAAPSVSPTVVSQSQQAPASSTPAPATSTPSQQAPASSTPAPVTSTPSPTSTANPIQTSSTKPSSTSKPPSSATTSAVQFTGSGRTLHPAGIFFLTLTTVLAAVLSILI